MFDDLTAGELAMLGHSLRMVPENACLTEGPLVKDRLAFFHEIPEFVSLWEKVAEALREREDMEPHR